MVVSPDSPPWEVMSVGGDSPPASDELADPIIGEASGGGQWYLSATRA